MRGIGRLTVVTTLAVAGFIFALVNFRQVPAKECQMDADHNPAYSFRIEEPPEVNTTTYHLLVTHNGKPVTGATACMRADMGGAGNMSGMGASNIGREVGPGRYEVDIRFEMSGHWEGRAVVQEPGKRPVGTRISIEVA